MPESDVGSYFGKYFLLKRIAAGGMGEVFLAKQQGPAGFEKILIIKKVLAHLTENKEFVELFLGEARLAARMNHRNIVQVFELGEENGAYFIAMEYVQGKSLRDVIDAAAKRKEKVPAELCRSVVEQICDGSAYAHNLSDITGRGLNIVHRDLNPQNVLVSYTGDVKVIDFGIAKSEMSTVKTEAGMIKGKFVYMSPEQSLAKKLDKRSDIFAIGITLYEMLTGTNPFHKNNIVLTLEAVQRLDPSPVSEFDPALAPFDPIIAKSLAKDRDRRYSDAAEMQDDLRRIVLPPAPERLGQFMGRIFRQQVEEEQKILKDTDSARVTSAAQVARKTPAKAAPPIQKTQEEARESGDEQGGTAILSPTAKPPSRSGQVKVAPKPPARRAPPVVVAQADDDEGGAGDTLTDLDRSQLPIGLAAGSAGSDDEPGATAMLKPGQEVPAFSRSRPSQNNMLSTMPDVAPVPPRQPQRGAPRRPGGPPANGGVGSTNIMTPEEAAAAQKEALERSQTNSTVSAVSQVSGNKRPSRSAAPPPKKSGKGLWIAIGVGGVVIVGLFALLGSMLFSDDAKPKTRPKPAPVAATEAPVEPAKPAPPPDVPKKPEPKPEPKAEVKPPPPAPVEPKPAPPQKQTPLAPPPSAAETKAATDKAAEKAAAKAAADKAAADKAAADKAAADKAAADKAAASKPAGTFFVIPGPDLAVSYNGKSDGKSAAPHKLSVVGTKGKVEVGDSSNPIKITIDYTVSGKQLTLKLRSEPWSILTLDDAPKGKTGTSEIKLGEGLTKLEFKNPGQDSATLIRLRFQPAN